jgi:DNA processing protein
MDEEKLYQVALSLIPGVGNYLVKNLISYCGSARAVFTSSRPKLCKIPGIGPKTVESILKSNILQQAEQELLKANQQDARVLAYTDKDYPARLKQVADAPGILYYKGKAALNERRSVAIVGTRQATRYGKQLTEQLVSDLAPFQPLIISGLAYGIDIYAHRAALRSGLPTLGIMASGLDIIYPAVHKNTAMEMLEQGGLMSENSFGTQPEAFKFPERNRIIAGMADVVIVVEAAVKGGALITADLANSYDREVFAAPGSLYSPQSAGCNLLIKQTKAHMFTSVEDMAGILNWSLDRQQPTQKEISFDAGFNPQETLVIKILQEHPAGLHIDELSWRTQIAVTHMASTLLQLEFKNVIRSLPGKKFTLQQ